jgi:simple sugar transport system substrate-binding protein
MAVALLVAALAGCGEKTEVREDPVVVEERGAPSGADARTPRPEADVRIAVVTHGQASSPFWAIVRNGVEAAARQVDATVAYRAPDVYSVDRMRALVREAIAERPDGLVVSIPEPPIASAVRRAVRAGIPVVSINSGSDISLRLGALAHVGQPEHRAGLRAGRRLADAGVERALCVNQQPGNRGLDQRCRGLAEAMRAAGGTSRVLAVNDQSTQTPRRIAAAVEAGGRDGVLALNATTAGQTIEGLQDAGARDVRVATFDLGPEVLEAVRAGRLLFAVDQQAYLQGYLPVVFLTQRARYGLFPAEGDVVATGPNFVTRETAARAIELSRRSIR